jgi:lipoyl(octanoyl) transferase
MTKRRIRVHRLGLVRYGEAHALQERLQEARVRGAIPDTLLLLEHPPVITLGRGAKIGNVLAARDALAARGIDLHETGRGGDVTYHGPGQLVGYPIFDLSPDRRDVRRYVRDLEEVMIRTVADFGLAAERIAGMNGTWLRDPDLGDRKIGAVGVRISRWVTMHGFALNVSTDLSHFALIVPCGIRDKAVTTMSLELDRGPLAIEPVLEACERRIAAVFDAELEPAPLPDLDTLAPIDDAQRLA